MSANSCSIWVLLLCVTVCPMQFPVCQLSFKTAVIFCHFFYIFQKLNAILYLAGLIYIEVRLQWLKYFKVKIVWLFKHDSLLTLKSCFNFYLERSGYCIEVVIERVEIIDCAVVSSTFANFGWNQNQMSNSQLPLVSYNCMERVS